MLPYLAVQDGGPAQPHLIFRDTMVTGSIHLLPKRKTTCKWADESLLCEQESSDRSCVLRYNSHMLLWILPVLKHGFLLAGYSIACMSRNVLRVSAVKALVKIICVRCCLSCMCGCRGSHLLPQILAEIYHHGSTSCSRWLFMNESRQVNIKLYTMTDNSLNGILHHQCIIRTRHAYICIHITMVTKWFA